MDGARRAMRATYQREVDDLEAHLAFSPRSARCRPTSACSAPWGIMNAFRGLSNVGSATPPTWRRASPRRWSPPPSASSRRSPAVVAYNRFAHDIDRIAIRFESFTEEFLNILQRQLR